MNAWDLFDSQEYSLSCQALQRLDKAANRIYEPDNGSTAVTNMYELWLAWQANECSMSTAEIRERCFPFAWFIADRLAVTGRSENSILIADRVVKMQYEQWPQLKWSTVILHALCKRASYLIAAGKFDDALEAMGNVLPTSKPSLDKLRMA